MEIIAKKSKFYLVTGLILLCAGIIFLGLVIRAFLSGIGKWESFLYVFVELLLTPTGIVLTVLYCLKPNVAVSRQGDTLYFAKGSCKISEIVNVNYRQFRRGYFWGYGLLTIQLNDRTVRTGMIQDVQRVHNRIYQLMMESKNENPNYDKVNV